MTSQRMPNRSRSQRELAPVWLSATDWPTPWNWSEVFGGAGPVELEIGCGKGLFLLHECRRRPEVHFLGIEVARQFARHAAACLARQYCDNVRILAADAREVLLHCPNQQTQRIHIYFPDPWWKKKHRKRRLVNAPLLIQCARLLPRGGELWLATDVADYHELMQELFATLPFFTPLTAEQIAAGPDPRCDQNFVRASQPSDLAAFASAATLSDTARDADPDMNAVPAGEDRVALTNFERKYRREGRPIYRLAFQRTDNPLPSLPTWGEWYQEYLRRRDWLVQQPDDLALRSQVQAAGPPTQPRLWHFYTDYLHQLPELQPFAETTPLLREFTPQFLTHRQRLAQQRQQLEQVQQTETPISAPADQLPD